MRAHRKEEEKLHYVELLIPLAISHSLMKIPGLFCIHNSILFFNNETPVITTIFTYISIRTHALFEEDQY